MKFQVQLKKSKLKELKEERYFSTYGLHQGKHLVKDSSNIYYYTCKSSPNYGLYSPTFTLDDLQNLLKNNSLDVYGRNHIIPVNIDDIKLIPVKDKDDSKEDKLYYLKYVGKNFYAPGGSNYVNMDIPRNFRWFLNNDTNTDAFKTKFTYEESTKFLADHADFEMVEVGKDDE